MTETEKTLSDELPCALFLLRRDATVAFANRTALRILGYDETELLRKSIDAVLEKPLAPAPADRSGGEVDAAVGHLHENFLRTRHFRLVPVLLFIPPGLPETRPAGGRALFAWPRGEQPVRPAAPLQKKTASPLTEALAGVVHDLNQPLNSMKIMCQAMLRDMDRRRLEWSDVSRELGEMIKQIDRMAESLYRVKSNPPAAD